MTGTPLTYHSRGAATTYTLPAARRRGPGILAAPPDGCRLIALDHVVSSDRERLVRAVEIAGDQLDRVLGWSHGADLLGPPPVQ